MPREKESGGQVSEEDLAIEQAKKIFLWNFRYFASAKYLAVVVENAAQIVL